MKIIAKNILGKNAISMQSGQNLYEKISTPLISGEEVEIDFQDVELFASPFFNASIGYLIKDIKVTDLQERLKIINLSTVGRQLLNHVISNAIKYYENTDKAEENMQIFIKNSEDH
ncbi:MAG: STAS-like domain-containing protein [Methylobacter sp.]